MELKLRKNPKKTKILITYGTRPEAIKLAPLIIKLIESKDFLIKICLTAQHRDLVDQVNKYFNLNPDYDLNVMTFNQPLDKLTSKIILSIGKVLDDFLPDLVILHGDTTTTFATALACFYKKITTAHVEAGLRTNDKFSPFPEEFNRYSTSYLSKWHFAPTKKSKLNLINEKISSSNILVTGNTIVDAVNMNIRLINNDENLRANIERNISKEFNEFLTKKKFIVITCHRRENSGKNFKKIIKILLLICNKFKEINLVFLKHMNPNVQPEDLLKKNKPKNLFIIKPMIYHQFLWLLKKSHLILTDSGGIQEEATTLKKPILVMRKNSERPEAIDVGSAKLVGTNEHLIISNLNKLLYDKVLYNKYIPYKNPFGNGLASDKIVNFLRKKYVK